MSNPRDSRIDPFFVGFVDLDLQVDGQRAVESSNQPTVNIDVVVFTNLDMLQTAGKH